MDNCVVPGDIYEKQLEELVTMMRMILHFLGRNEKQIQGAFSR